MNIRKIRGALVGLAAFATVLITASASAATAPPILVSPTSGSSSSSALFLCYTLPETAKEGTVIATFSGPGGESKVTLVGEGPGHHVEDLNLNELIAGNGENRIESVGKFCEEGRITTPGGAAIKSVEGAADLPDGVYSVTLSYQNAAGEAAAAVTATEVTLKNTTSPPVLLSPTVSEDYAEEFELEYSLAENPGTIGLRLNFEDLTHSESSTALYLNEPQPLTNRIAINLNDPLSDPAVNRVSGPEFRVGDTYELTLSYQNELGDPLVFSESDTFTYTGPTVTPCTPGTYSVSGHKPCEAAGAGHYVAEEGATAEIPCEPGTFNPDEQSISSAACVDATPGNYVAIAGASEESECPGGHYSSAADAIACRPADLGDYVPHPGEAAETECAAGTYSEFTGTITCTPTPKGYYDPKNSALPVACPTGTESEAGASSCKATPSKETPKEGPKETPKESPKETPKTPETPKALECKVSAPAHQLSLLHTRKQAYTLSCNLMGTASAHLVAKASVVISVGHKHLILLAKPAAIKATNTETLSSTFKLTAAAKKMLESHKARVVLTVSVMPTGSGHSLVGKGTISGRK